MTGVYASRDFRVSERTIARYSALFSGLLAGLFALAFLGMLFFQESAFRIFPLILILIPVASSVMFVVFYYSMRGQMRRHTLRISDAIQVMRPSGVERSFAFASVQSIRVVVDRDHVPMRIDVGIESYRFRMTLAGYEDMPGLLAILKDRVPAHCKWEESLQTNPYYVETRAMAVFALIVAVPVVGSLYLMDNLAGYDHYEVLIKILFALLCVTLGAVWYLRRRSRKNESP